MFGNLINRHDLIDLFIKGRRVAGRLASRLLQSRRQKVITAWSHTDTPPINWWDLPQVQARWNRLITGDSRITSYRYIAEKYLAGRTVTALSLGCGTGSAEIRWAESGCFSRIDAYDLSAPRIVRAMQVAEQQGWDHILHYAVGDIYRLHIADNAFDVVLVEQSLHHFSPLETVLRTISRALKPDGLFILHEFVGPSRFQWTNRQLTVVNSLLRILPEKYKTKWDSAEIKKEVFRPSRWRMLYNDPSEAVESANILSLMAKYFDIVEMKEYGGTVLHLLLYEIAHHFLPNDPEADKWLALFFEVEDLLLQTGELPSDHIVAVCKNK
ncbi:class I SAM-dependent methyltransferase [bacterium]|nr:class I SAM-dependent methyltransferase [bacterium]